MTPHVVARRLADIANAACHDGHRMWRSSADRPGAGGWRALATRGSAAMPVLGLSMATLILTPASAATTRMIGRFAPDCLDVWEHKSFKGETQYRLVGHGDTRALEATCDASASAIAQRKKVNLSKTPVLRWE